jgi:hypothetical protein
MKAYQYLITASVLLSSYGGCTTSAEEVRNLSIHGIVMDKYKLQTGCFGAIVVKHEGNYDSLKNFCYCVVEREKIWDYVLPKDSLSKEEGSLIVKVFRDGVEKEFDYPFCNQ